MVEDGDRQRGRAWIILSVIKEIEYPIRNGKQLKGFKWETSWSDLCCGSSFDAALMADSNGQD